MNLCIVERNTEKGEGKICMLRWRRDDKYVRKRSEWGVSEEDKVCYKMWRRYVRKCVQFVVCL